MMTRPTHRITKPLILMSIFLLAGLQLASAQPGRGMLSGNLVDNPKVKKALDLTDEQVSTIKDGMRDIDRKLIKNRTECELLRMDLETAYDADKIDADKVRDITKKLAEAQAKQFEIQSERRLLLTTTLTAEQRDKAKEKMREFMGKGDRPMRQAMRQHFAQGRRGGQGSPGGPGSFGMGWGQGQNSGPQMGWGAGQGRGPQMGWGPGQGQGPQWGIGPQPGYGFGPQMGYGPRQGYGQRWNQRGDHDDAPRPDRVRRRDSDEKKSEQSDEPGGADYGFERPGRNGYRGGFNLDEAPAPADNSDTNDAN